MNQIVHIFLKDARCLRIEIGVFMLLAAIFAGVGGRVAGSEILLEAGAIYLIARVVHADPIPGDRQFWLTRPYNRMSLAGAKLLFIVAFVCAPICVAQIAILLARGFPLLAGIPGLLWSQVVIFFVSSLLIAALAATTSNTLILILALLLLGAATLIGEIFYPIAANTYLPYRPTGPDWIRQYLALAILTFTAAFVLFRQYRDRATTFSRIAGTVGLAIAAGLFLWLPTSAALAAQSWFSGPPPGKFLNIGVDPSLKGRGVWVSGGRDPLYRLWRIPLWRGRAGRSAFRLVRLAGKPQLDAHHRPRNKPAPGRSRSLCRRRNDSDGFGLISGESQLSTDTDWRSLHHVVRRFPNPRRHSRRRPGQLSGRPSVFGGRIRFSCLPFFLPLAVEIGLRGVGGNAIRFPQQSDFVFTFSRQREPQLYGAAFRW
jgi:hypothetical protein